MPGSALPETTKPPASGHPDTVSRKRLRFHIGHLRAAQPRPSATPPSPRLRTGLIGEQQVAECLVLMERLADRRPFPLRLLAIVVVHPVEVGAPARACLRRNVLQRCQQGVRNEK